MEFDENKLADLLYDGDLFLVGGKCLDRSDARNLACSMIVGTPPHRVPEITGVIDIDLVKLTKVIHDGKISDGYPYSWGCARLDAESMFNGAKHLWGVGVWS